MQVVMAESGHWEVPAGNWKVDRRENLGDFSPPKPCTTSPVVAILPPWLVEDSGFVKMEASTVWGALLRKKNTETEIRSRASEGIQEGRKPQSICLISFLMTLSLPTLGLLLGD